MLIFKRIVRIYFLSEMIWTSLDLTYLCVVVTSVAFYFLIFLRVSRNGTLNYQSTVRSSNVSQTVRRDVSQWTLTLHYKFWQLLITRLFLSLHLTFLGNSSEEREIYRSRLLFQLYRRASQTSLDTTELIFKTPRVAFLKCIENFRKRKAFHDTSFTVATAIICWFPPDMLVYIGPISL